MTTAENYLTAIIFELSYVKFPGQPMETVTKNWASINDLLNKHSRFGGQIAKLKFLKEEAKNFKSEYPEPAERMAAIYQFVRKNMKWNGKRRLLASKSLQSAFKKGQGSSADINLLLTLLLKHAGLDAAPVALSTRDNGLLNPVYPSVSQFNYVVAGVKIGEGYMVLDATDKNRPAHLLPFRSLNGQGRWINEKEGHWVELRAGANYDKITQGEFTIDEAGNFSGKMQRILKGYSALSARNTLAGAEDQAEYVNKIQEAYSGLSIENPAIENAEDLQKKMKEAYEVKIEEQSNVSGDFIYFSPMLCFAEDENPFKLEERQFPIDYGYPISETISMRFTIPENYIVDELPEKAVIALPNDGGKFTYHVVQTPKEIMINSKCKIKQSLFLSDDYVGLKEFYNLMIEKHAEQVVLKKRT